MHDDLLILYMTGTQTNEVGCGGWAQRAGYKSDVERCGQIRRNNGIRARSVERAGGAGAHGLLYLP